jgi:hypothetical protein
VIYSDREETLHVSETYVDLYTGNDVVALKYPLQMRATLRVLALPNTKLSDPRHFNLMPECFWYYIRPHQTDLGMCLIYA